MRRRTWREAGCYVWRTRKPHAPIGLPLLGRHFGYAGESSSFYHRDAQHLGQPVPGQRYEGVQASWSDLDPRRYPLPCAFPNNATARKIQETLWIALLKPVYNVQKNWLNPRRISRKKALELRAARQLNGRTFSLPRAAYRLLFALVFWPALGYALAYLLWEPR
jgi:hypothetical protein